MNSWRFPTFHHGRTNEGSRLLAREAQAWRALGAQHSQRRRSALPPTRPLVACCIFSLAQPRASCWMDAAASASLARSLARILSPPPFLILLPSAYLPFAAAVRFLLIHSPLRVRICLHWPAWGFSGACPGCPFAPLTSLERAGPWSLCLM